MKRFLYLTQTSQDLPERLRGLEGPDSDIRFLSWRAPSTDPRSVFYPHSSWTQGRNRLLLEGAGTGYLYYVFLDDDVVLDSVDGREERNPWRVLEELLLEYEPAVGFPRYEWHLVGGHDDTTKAVQSLRFFDAVLNAFHREAVWHLLPYYDLLDDESECYSQNVLCSVAASLYPGHLLQFNGLSLTNLEHRRTDREFALFKPEQLFLTSLRSASERSRFLRQTVGVGARHVALGKPQAKQGRSYAVSPDEHERRFLGDHPLWQRKRHLSELPRDADFWREGPDTDRARQRQEARTETPGAVDWLRFRSATFRARHGLTRPVLAAAVRRHRVWARSTRTARFIHGLLDRAAKRRLTRWLSTGSPVLERASRSRIMRRLASALEMLEGDRITFIEVGVDRGEALRLLRAGVSPRKIILSIGIDPDGRGRYRPYSGFVEGAVLPADSDRPSANGYHLSTIVRQYALDDEILHFVKISVPGADAPETFLSLGELAQNCLFVQLPAVGDRAKLHAAGFRRFAGIRDREGAEAVFANAALFSRLFAPERLATSK
jgi:hypothetical protein